MQTAFRIRIRSDLDYEELIAEIIYQGDTVDEIVALISQENGVNSLRIEIFTPTNELPWNFFFEDFFHALESAKKNLIRTE